MFNIARHVTPDRRASVEASIGHDPPLTREVTRHRRQADLIRIISLPVARLGTLRGETEPGQR